MKNVLFSCIIIISFGFSSFSNAKEPNFDDMQQAIQERKLCSIEDTLNWLSQAFPKYTQNFTLMRESLSLQEASPSSPRTILFGEEASLLLTFNGESSQRGGQVIELAQLRTSPIAHWEFREIEFFDCQKPPLVSEVNPVKCARCHTTNFNPIWNHYDRWPGAYGENDDGVLDLSLKYNSPANSSGDYDQKYGNDDIHVGTDYSQIYSSEREKSFVEKTNKVLADFLNWKSRQPEHPRYKYLRFDPANKSKCAPYTDESPRSKPYSYRPNLRLTHALAKQQGRVVADRMRSFNPSCYQVLAPAVLSEFLKCSSSSNESRAKLDQFNNMLLSHREEVATYFSEYGHTTHSWTSFSNNPKDLEKSILLRLLGIDSRDWNMSFQANSWSYFVGTVYMQDEVMSHLYEHYRKNSPLKLPKYEAFLAKYYSSYYSYEEDEKEPEEYQEPDYQRYPANGYPEPSYERPADKACRMLTSSEFLPDFSAIRENCMDENTEELTSERERKVRSILSVCSDCHVGKNAPPIPFDKPEELSGWKDHILSRLRNQNQRQMPPERGLSDQDKFWLSRWLTTGAD